MSSERRFLSVAEDLEAALSVILRWIKEMTESDMLATVRRIDEGVKHLNGTVATHDEQLQAQKLVNATTAMMISQIQKDQKALVDRIDKLVSQFVWGARVVGGAIILQILAQIFIK